MDEACSRSTTRPRHRLLAGSAVFVAVGAWLGAYGLVTGWLSLEDVARRLPLASPVLGGIALAAWVALPFTLLAVRAWRGHAGTGPTAIVCGVALVAWLLVQLAFIHTLSWFHPAYALIGVGFVAAGRRIRDRRVPDVDRAAVERFLAAGRIVLVGATDDPRKFGSTVCRALIDHGHDVVPVNPRRSTVAGRPCRPDLAAVEGDIDAVMVMVSGDSAVDVVRACVERGVAVVWLFRGAGEGAASDAAIEQCRRSGIDVVAGACPLMFLDPVTGMHQAHLAVRRFSGAVA